MKTCICTTPIRPKPTNFPPFGSMAIIQSLRGAGEDVSFYNIDYFRFSPEQVENHFRSNQFDVVGISAVVSTAYAYTKYLSKLIRDVSPKTVIVLGGNLAASAEILLRKCNIDFCVAGDGELIILELYKILKDNPRDYARLKQTKGLCFIDDGDKFCFTGYGQKPSADQIAWPDYSILEADGSLQYFIPDIKDYGLSGETEFEGVGKRLATVNMTKGCVARCTFCHRWEKGFRARPVDQIVAHVTSLRDKYDVGYIVIADENFGSDRDLARELTTELGKLKMPWRCQGVRARTVTKEILQHWKDNGCVEVIYGTESGSQTMLNIMEKGATVEENVNALRWVSEVGMGTIIQLVLGMPGETDTTIRETIEFLKDVSRSLNWWQDKAPSELISINYAQALPGTPLYEWAREHGHIGRTIDEEEKYLLRISDTDAYSEDHFINYTGLPTLRVLMWRPWILAELDAHHFVQQVGSADSARFTMVQLVRYYLGLVAAKLEKRMSRGNFASRMMLHVIAGKRSVAATPERYDHVRDSGYFNINANLKFAPLLLNPGTRRHFFALMAVAVALQKGRSHVERIRLLADYFVWAVTGSKRRGPDVPAISLRKIVKIVPADPQAPGIDLMTPLRKGR